MTEVLELIYEWLLFLYVMNRTSDMLTKKVYLFSRESRIEIAINFTTIDTLSLLWVNAT